MRKFSLTWVGGLTATGLLALAATAADAPTPDTTPVATPAASSSPAAAGTAGFEQTVQPFVEKYCYECHGDGLHKGSVALDKYKNTGDVEKDAATWETVLEKIHRHEMPPDNADAQPTEQERDTMVNWIDQQIHQFDPAHPDPGRITLHRLNRAEYTNTIRDLTGITFHADEDFPPDDSGYGFDNIGDVLSLPPMLMEKYLSAADKVLDQALPTDPLTPQTHTFQAALLASDFNGLGPQAGGVRLISLEEGHVSVDQDIPAPGEYRVSFEASGSSTGGTSPNGVGYKSDTDAPSEVPHMALRVGETVLHQFTIDATDQSKPGTYSWEVGLPAGTAQLHAVMERDRGGANENIIVNGRVGKQQNGQTWVKSISIEGPLPGAVTRYPASELAATGTSTLNPQGERFFTDKGDVSAKFTVTKAGEYILRAYAYAQQAGKEPTKMDLRIDGQSLQTFDVLAPARHILAPGAKIFSGHPSALALLRGAPQVYEIHTTLTPGEKTFSAAFLNPFADPNNEDLNLRQRDLTIMSLEVVDLSAPFKQPDKSPVIQAYFAQPVTPANQSARAREIISQFALRAWRRPADPAEIDRLLTLSDLALKNGDSFETGIKLAMKAILVSPHFLFRDGNPAPAMMAGQPAPQFIKTVLENTPATKHDSPSLGVPVDEYTLATRLSYFLWSSTPDDELLDLAGKNQLRANLADQVKRMIASPKSRAMVDNFAGQWLQFRSLDTFEPDPTMFPDFTPTLRTEMRQETENFFDYIMHQDRSVMDFLTADYTFINEDLANYYGLTGVTGDAFQKVSLTDTPRRGVISQGSVLVLTSNPTRTSPVKRGKWVLENLLGTPPPPPPANVPALDSETELTGTLRQQMEQHRANPTCASCHARMDPIGFGLENFDATGEWRDKDGDADIDSSGTLLTGETFKGAADLMNILAVKKKTDFLRCLSEKMLTYALGRGLDYYDRPATDQIITQLDQGGDKFSALINAVVNSVPFQQIRRPDAEPKKDAAGQPAEKLSAN